MKILDELYYLLKHSPETYYESCQGIIRADSSKFEQDENVNQDVFDILCVLKNLKRVAYTNYALYTIDPNFVWSEEEEESDSEKRANDMAIGYQIPRVAQKDLLYLGLHVANLFQSNWHRENNIPRCTLIFEKENYKYARCILQTWIDYKLFYNDLNHLIIGYCIGYPHQNIIGYCLLSYDIVSCDYLYKEVEDYVSTFLSKDNDKIANAILENNYVDVICDYLNEKSDIKIIIN